MGIGNHIIGNPPITSRHCHGLTTQRLRQPKRVSDAVALLLRQLEASVSFDVERRPGRVQPVRQALGEAHQTGGARILADADENPLAGCPWSRDGTGLHLGEQLLVDALGRAAERSRNAVRLAGEKKCSSARSACCGM